MRKMVSIVRNSGQRWAATIVGRGKKGRKMGREEEAEICHLSPK